VCEKESERQTSCFFICCFKQTSLALAIQLKSNSVAGRLNKNKIEKNKNLNLSLSLSFRLTVFVFCVFGNKKLLLVIVVEKGQL
jgi:hypothetical protein